MRTLITVNELINGCQNQWNGRLFDYNPHFKIIFKFMDCENIETWTIKDFNNYTCDGISNDFITRQLTKRHEQGVRSWQMIDMNTIEILVYEM